MLARCFPSLFDLVDNFFSLILILDEIERLIDRRNSNVSK